MLVILILITLPNISTKLYPTIQDLNNVKSSSGAIHITGDPLWVLNLSNEEWLDAKLRLGTFAEEEDFYLAFGHLKEEPQKAFAKVKKDDLGNPKHLPQITSSTPFNKEIVNDIMKMINKFALHTSMEPDIYVTENNDENNPSIVLYFKGSASCLIVKQGNKEWHYLIKTMLFPAWFYEPHDTFEAPLAIPNEVRNPFFVSLLRFLRLVLSHPV